MKPTHEIHQEVTAARLPASYRTMMIGFGALAFVGALMFVISLTGARPERAWQAYLVNFVFWTGLTCGSVLFSAILTITNARWGRPIKRLAEALGAFLPVAFVLFWILYLGKDRIFPWLHEPVHHPAKEAWLQTGFLFARDGLGLLLLIGVGMTFIYHSVQRDRKMGHTGEISPVEDERHRHASSMLAPAFAILYAFVLSLIAFDLIMTLDPHWISTLFGAYYFIGSFYSALAAIVLLSGIAVMGWELDRFIHSSQFHDLGKLMLGFCIVTGDFFYAQFLVIWYGNLPEETRYIILRLRQSPWEYLSWTVLIACFVVPFLVLLIRRIKMKPALMMVLAALILVGMWLERFLLVAPSLWKDESIPLGFMEILISAGFLGMVALCVLLFLRQFPLLPIADPLLYESLEATRPEGHASIATKPQ